MSAPWAWKRRSARLRRRLPLATAGDVLGDLHEDYRRRLARDGRLRAEWWLARQMWSVARTYARYDPTRPSIRSRCGVPNRRELAQTVRSLFRARWYAITAVAVVALGTALGTAVFAIVDGTLFKPLPYAASSRLFAVSLGYSRIAEPFTPWRAISSVTVAEWRASVPDLAFSAFYIGGLQPVGRQDLVRNADVDQAFFDVLGIHPVTGGFASEDFSATSKIRPAIVTATFWRQRFATSTLALGQILRDETGAGIRIVGVLPDTFLFPSVTRGEFTPELLTPLVRDPTDTGNSLRVIARLAPGAYAQAAADQLNAVVAAQAAARPALMLPPNLAPRARIIREGVDRGSLESIDSALRSGVSRRAWVVFGAAAALVLLACFNVTGLVIARARERHRDLAVRRALGAGTRDLVRLLGLETVVVVMSGAVVGFLLAWWVLPVGARLFADDFMLTLKPAAIDIRVATFAALLAAAGAMVVVLLSVRAVGRAGLQQPLAEGARITHRAVRRLSMVSFEVAVAYLLTVTAALVVGSLLRAWREDTGFEVPDAAVLRMSAPRNATAGDIEQLVADIGRLPGVVEAGGVAHAFLEKAFNGSVFSAPPGVRSQADQGGGRGGGPGGLEFPIESVPVTHGFFPAAGLKLRDGRWPTQEEFQKGARLIVITQTVARDYWPGQRAVGQVLLSGGTPYEVIGVVDDARFLALDMVAQGEIFWPIAAMPQPYLSSVMIRLAPGDDERRIDEIAATVRTRCPDCWVREATTLEGALAESIRPRRFNAWLFSGFGLAALAIVGTGILGVVAMTTTRRVREIGIRMALGATRRGVVAQLLGEQIASVLIGLVLGGLAAWWATTFLTSYLYETEPTDGVAWLAAAGGILAVACVGAYVPAARASRMDPVKALRVEE